MPNRLAPTSLTGRLVATAVALVAVVSVLVAAVTAFAMHGYLTDRLDTQVQDTVRRAVVVRDEHGPPGKPPPYLGSGHGHDADEVRLPPGPPGTLTAYLGDAGARGSVVTPQGTIRDVPQAALRTLSAVPTDGQVHELHLPGLGGYRVLANDNGSLVAGLPNAEIDSILGSLLRWEFLLAAAGVAVAAVVGLLLVRRQLRPLRRVAATAHEVTELPLASGEIGVTVRVPDQLTDARTEVGQVGAALNKLLVHVEDALDARHRSEQQVRQFVADASHELRTPLSTIQGYAELSRRDQEPDAGKLAAALAKVESEATRMSSLVEDLLLLARLDAGRPLDRSEVDLTKLVLEAVADARILAPGHRWQLDLPDDPVLVTGDEQRLHQVVTNLLNNARRHTPPGTAVTVGARSEPDAVVLTVGDDGPGLPEVLRGKVFERFSRGDTSRTRASGGAGLGLSLVQAITVAHGGSVHVRSEPGDTEFSVVLPARALSGDHGAAHSPRTVRQGA
jgi:two-component system OmpR family sensor kinase